MSRDATSDLHRWPERRDHGVRAVTRAGCRPGVVRVANADGGTVLLGVTDTGKVVGVADHNRLKARVLSTARSAEPPIEVEVESAGEVLRVAVPPQKRKPYSFGGRFLMRDGASSRQLVSAELEDLFYAAGRPHFDRRPCPDFRSSTTSTTKPGPGSAAAPRSPRPWIAWRPCGTSGCSTAKTA